MSAPVYVQVTATDAGATAGVDYEAGPWDVTIPAGETEGSFAFASIGDAFDEDNAHRPAENVRFLIDGATLPNAVTLGTGAAATLTIAADDRSHIRAQCKPQCELAENGGTWS